MYIRMGHELIFSSAAPTPMNFLLRLHPSEQQKVLKEKNGLEPATPVHFYHDFFGNCVGRLAAPPGTLRLWSDLLVRDEDEPDPVIPGADQCPVEKLPEEVLPYLYSSRYCEVDKLNDLAWSLFAGTPPGWARVQAVCDWVHSHVRFGYPFARATKSAWDVFEERAGVCRDFTHLALTLCRCLNIPARYATGYLGDIRTAPQPAPMDFSAWFQAYLDGQWYNFDARFNEPRFGRTLMAIGRDATDVALTTSFGNALLQKMTVWCYEVDSPDLAIGTDMPS